jgi:hypothetical protein
MEAILFSTDLFVAAARLAPNAADRDRHRMLEAHALALLIQIKPARPQRAC